MAVSARRRASERLVTTVLGLAAAACFLLPLFHVAIPLKRDRTVRGTDLVFQIVKTIREVQADAREGERSAPAEDAAARPEEVASKTQARKEPVSVRCAWLLAVFVPGALVCSLLLALTAAFGTRGVRAASALGALLGLAAIAQISIINWQVHSMFLGGAGGERHGFHPFAHIAAALGHKLARAFRMTPMSGLHGLTFFLLLAAVVSCSGILSRRGASGTAPERDRE